MHETFGIWRQNQKFHAQEQEVSQGGTASFNEGNFRFHPLKQISYPPLKRGTTTGAQKPSLLP